MTYNWTTFNLQDALSGTLVGFRQTNAYDLSKTGVFERNMNKVPNYKVVIGGVVLGVNKEGVVETKSGLQYKVVTMGTGAKPSATDTVKVHYHGTLIDGTVFDSSVQRGEPIVFPLNQVIPGWTEGLQLMPVGSKFTFYIPQELAYGSHETGAIKPFSALVFEVELLGIE